MNFITIKKSVRLHIDFSVFRHLKNKIIVIIYVNNLLIIDFNEKNIIAFKKSLSKRFRIKNLNFVFFYLNVKIARNRINKIMHFSQTIYIKQLVETCEFIDCKSIFISMKQTSLYHDIFDDQFY